jgi:hypothetical protein
MRWRYGLKGRLAQWKGYYSVGKRQRHDDYDLTRGDPMPWPNGTAVELMRDCGKPRRAPRRDRPGDQGHTMTPLPQKWRHNASKACWRIS